MSDTTEFYYATKYSDETHEFRAVHVPPAVLRVMPRNRLLAESEWRALGVQQSRGWYHYSIHGPEPHILLFRRRKPVQQTNNAPQNNATAAAADATEGAPPNNVEAAPKKATKRKAGSGH